jgi:hypothetical protein
MDLTGPESPRNLFPVARERRDARPRGRVAGPEAEPTQQDTSTEVARMRAPAAPDRTGGHDLSEGAGGAGTI